MRILLITIQFAPDVNSTGILMERIGEGLVRRGHEVSVITSFPHYEHFRVLAEYRGRLLERTVQKGMRVLRVPVYAPGKKDRMFHRALSYISFNFFAALCGLVASERPDVILCQSGSFLSGLASHVGGRPRGIPFVYNVQDLYPEVPILQGKLTSPGLIGLTHRFADYTYDRAAHVAVIAPAFRKALLERGLPAEKISVIPNGADVEFIRPLPKDNEWSRANGLADRFVVAHAGNVGWVYGLDAMLEVAARTKDLEDVVYLIVGEGVAKPSLVAHAERAGLTNVRFLPFQPISALPWVRGACDVQVALYKRHSAKYSMPSKAYEIMASGRPILASAEADSDLAQLVRSAQCGLVVEPEDPDSLEEAVRELHSNPARRASMGDAGRRLAEQDYSMDSVVERYESLLRRVANGGRNGSH